MAAGAVIVREARGVVTDTTGAPLDLWRGTVLACTPQIQGELLEALLPVDLDHDGAADAPALREGT
jgi:myo-inositol-1(or 4)-monophosphatase